MTATTPITPHSPTEPGPLARLWARLVPPPRTVRQREADWIRKALTRRGFTQATDTGDGFRVNDPGAGPFVVACGRDRVGAYWSALAAAGWNQVDIVVGSRVLRVQPRRAAR